MTITLICLALSAGGTICFEPKGDKFEVNCVTMFNSDMPPYGGAGVPKCAVAVSSYGIFQLAKEPR